MGVDKKVPPSLGRRIVSKSVFPRQQDPLGWQEMPALPAVGIPLWPLGLSQPSLGLSWKRCLVVVGHSGPGRSHHTSNLPARHLRPPVSSSAVYKPPAWVFCGLAVPFPFWALCPPVEDMGREDGRAGGPAPSTPPAAGEGTLVPMGRGWDGLPRSRPQAWIQLSPGATCCLTPGRSLQSLGLSSCLTAAVI